MDGTRRVTLRQAAEELGVSVEAVRKRVKRGSLRADKGPDGRVYVFLDTSGDEYHPQPGVEGSMLIEALRDEIGHLRRESERKDTIILSLSQSNAELSRTIRQLEPPRESPERPERPERAEPANPEREEPERAEPADPERGEPERVEPRPDPTRPREGSERPSWRQRVRGLRRRFVG